MSDGYWLDRLAAEGNLPDIVEHVMADFEPLVATLARRYWQPIMGAEQEDLEQVARVGLLNACANFDRKKGAFPTHATWYMRQSLAAYIESLENPVKLPAHLLRKLPKLRPLKHQLAQDLQREPTVQDVAEAMGLSEGAVALLFAYDKNALSFDETVRKERTTWDSRTTLYDVFASDAPSPEDILIQKETERGK